MIRCSTLQAFSVKNKTLENPLEIITKSCSCSGITTFLRIPFSHKYASHIRICICWILHLYYPGDAGTQERLERVAVSQSHSVPATTWHILWMSIISLIVFSKLLLHFPHLREFLSTNSTRNTKSSAKFYSQLYRSSFNAHEAFSYYCVGTFFYTTETKKCFLPCF